PVAREASFSKGTVTISFDNAAEGLLIKGDINGALKVTRNGEPLKYEVATDKDLLLIMGIEGNGPVKIEYCEENYCSAVLFNSEGNPVYGFTFEIKEA
ncbi:MAG: hypothetical protein IKZ39_01710, partial [Lachnospiraceae bacterium]|nr:hypothetical protein [Lachnospiraceae bacterium]